ncbi:hypothetical protein FCM35_KLT02961 [Carex littledalei]|uniref:CCHC-type domain-containing protein n=1 Tax=Carex littledalei TaxID=544730 RepID=A0A833QS95_9POAL|nr:hypothetical protein FCM35_KLT02961 [Carex littledalei]
MSAGEWQMVARRKKYPPHWRHAPHPVPTAQPYQPYKLTYAQTLRNPPPLLPTNTTLPPKAPANPPATSPTSSASHKTATTNYISPHSQLRFPPSPQFKEWRGLCFRCCKWGHAASHCKNLTRCGRCWGEGHTGSHCSKKTSGQTTARLPPPVTGTKPITKLEPSFDELLSGPYPYPPKSVPEGRPARTYCYAGRDAQYYAEMVRLQRAVVLYAPEIEIDLTIDEVAECAAKTGLVKMEDISVAVLTRSRYLISLPTTITPAAFIRAIPDEVWSLGYSFSQWSPLVDAAVKIPQFKVLIDIVGVPPQLYREDVISKAISAFGVYLGMVEQDLKEEMACWTAAVATVTLDKIPLEINFVDGGLETVAQVLVKTWAHVPLYSKEEMPRPTKEYTSPPCVSPPAAATTEDVLRLHTEPTVPVPIRILRDICQGRDPNSLPRELAAVLANTQMEPPPLPESIATPTQTSPVTENQNLVNVPVMAQCDESHVASPQIEREQIVTPKVIQSPPKRILTRRMHANQTATEEPDCGAESLPLAVSGTKAGEGSKYLLRSSRQDKHMVRDNRQQESNSCKTRARITEQRFNLESSLDGPNRPHGPSAVSRQRRRLTLAAIRPKRNSSTKKKNRAEPQAASFNLNPDGFVEIRVDYDQRLAIASACGINLDHVTTALKEDNEQRFSLPEAQPNRSDPGSDEEHLNLDLSSDDELTDLE